MVPEIWSMTDRIFCNFGPSFALLPPQQPENQNFEKMKTTPGDIIILHICTITDNHTMYGSWDNKRDGQNFLSFWTVFWPFTTRKIKILKNWKKRLEIPSFYTSIQKIMIIRYTVPEIWRVMAIYVIFHFGLFFAFLPP